MVIDELITLLGFEVDGKENLDKYNKSIDEAKGFVLALGAAAAATATAIFSFLEGTATRVDELAKFSDRVGESIETVQELGYAAEANGSSMESLQSTLSNLNQKISETSRGQGNAVQFFGQLGVGITKSNGELKKGSELLVDLADKFKNLDSAKQLEFARGLGISDDLLVTLKSGSAGIADLRNEAQSLGFVLDSNAADASGKFGDQVARVSKILQGLKDVIAVGLMPRVTEIIHGFEQWFLANKSIVQQRLNSFLNGLVSVLQFLWNILSAVIDTIKLVVGSFVEWKTVVKLVTAGLLALVAVKIATFVSGLTGLFLAGAAGIKAFNFQLLLSKLAIGGAILAIALFIEDLIVYFQGGKSVTGDFIQYFSDKFSNVFALVRNLFEIFIAIFTGQFDELPGVFGRIFDAIVGIVESFISFIIGEPFKFSDVFNGAIQAVGDMIDWVVGKFDLVVNKITSILEPIKLVKKEIDGIIGGAQEKFGKFIGGGVSATETKNRLAAIYGNAATPVSNSSIASNDFSRQIANTNNNQNINATITVQGGGNGYQTGSDIADGIRDMARRVRVNNTNAVQF